MKRGYRSFLASALSVALIAATAVASEIKDENNPTPGDPSDPAAQANCDLTNYKSEVRVFSPPVSVPDANPTGVTVGPISIPDDGSLIEDVVIDLGITNTWIGDIIAVVGYDENCDGAVDVQSTIICRPGRTISCGTSGSGLGCSSNFAVGPYLFDDTAAASLPTTGCTSTTNVPAGCYRPTGLGAGPLSVFEGRRKGGCWFLTVSDNAGGDLTTLTQFSVHILNSVPIAVEPSSWGKVKVLYN